MFLTWKKWQSLDPRPKHHDQIMSCNLPLMLLRLGESRQHKNWPFEGEVRDEVIVLFGLVISTNVVFELSIAPLHLQFAMQLKICPLLIFP